MSLCILVSLRRYDALYACTRALISDLNLSDKHPISIHSFWDKISLEDKGLKYTLHATDTELVCDVENTDDIHLAEHLAKLFDHAQDIQKF